MELFGSPGKKSGLFLRIGQCIFSAASIGFMASASGFSSVTAFCCVDALCGFILRSSCEWATKSLITYILSYLIASMGLQVLWSFGLVCLDIHALRFNKDLHNHIVVSLFVVGDWVTATLSLAAACSSSGVMVLFKRDTSICQADAELSCSMYQISIAFAFISWFSIAISSHVMFWLVASS